MNLIVTIIGAAFIAAFCAILLRIETKPYIYETAQEQRQRKANHGQR